MKSLKNYIIESRPFNKNLKGDEKPLIEEWLEKYGVKNYKINDNLTIDVSGFTDLQDYDKEELPEYIQFNNSDTFYISGLNLKTLRGCPKKCFSFSCSNSPNLDSLEGGPKEVKRDFYCGDGKTPIKPNFLKGLPMKCDSIWVKCNETDNKLELEFTVKHYCKKVKYVIVNWYF